MKLTEMANRHYGLSMLPDETPYAMAYVPFQQEDAKIYSPDRGFVMGTMYPELDKPFYGEKCGDADD